MPNFVRAIAALCLALTLSACSGDADRLAGFASSPPPAGGNAAEQARLKLIDKCMFDASTNVSAKDKKGKAPRCQCYAKTVVQKLSPAEQASYAASGALPWSIKPDEILNSCGARA